MLTHAMETRVVTLVVSVIAILVGIFTSVLITLIHNRADPEGARIR